jgi:hypothetical protein
MESPPLLQLLPLEILAEILSYLDYTDQESAYYASTSFYHCRPVVLYSTIELRTEWLEQYENTKEIPRDELLSHNAFVRSLTRTLTISRPVEHVLDALVSYFAQELIHAWMYPVNERGLELRFNDSIEDTRIYHQRYPLLARLAFILRWNGVGHKVAKAVEEWLEAQWDEISDDENIQELIEPDLLGDPSWLQLTTDQTKLLQGIEFLALFPIIYYSPQTLAAERFHSPLNNKQWGHPGYNRLKLWLSIPELWSLDIRHVEWGDLPRPPWKYPQIATRKFLHLVLFRVSEFGAFGYRILQHLHLIELSTPYPDLIYGSRYWYEEGFCFSELYWSFDVLKARGNYMESALERPLANLIDGYLYLYGIATLSDLILNIVFYVRDKTLPVRAFISNAMTNELARYLQFLSEEAKESIIGLRRDANGVIVSGYVPVDHTVEPGLATGVRRS